MTLSERARQEIVWWLEHLEDSRKVRLKGSSVDIQQKQKASLEGWGANKGGLAIGGRWSEIEAQDHILVLTMKEGPRNITGRPGVSIM